MGSDPEFNCISLFAGAGGLDLAVRIAVPGSCTVCFVEREAYGAALVGYRMEQGDLHEAPVWSDVCTFDGTAWRGAVDLILAGFPCQDVSNAGRRGGIDGERSGLWRHVLRIVEECGASMLLIENVAALRGRGLSVILEELAARGFDAEWACLRASDVGAPHRRDRLFLLAYRNGDGEQFGRVRDMLDAIASQWNDNHGCHKDVGDAAISRHSQHAGVSGDDGQELATVERTGGSLFPPGPDSPAWEGVDAATQPCVHGLDDGVAHRVDRIRACGNGVVALQGAAAFVALARRAVRRLEEEAGR